MSALTNKTILIISPQGWGDMFISKHHYAIELAKKGNTVYFLNPPGEGGAVKPGSVEIVAAAERLYHIRHQIRFPYDLKFHVLPVFHVLMRPHIRRILKTIGKSNAISTSAGCSLIW